MNTPLVSCIMITYGRWTQVQRSLSMFLDQTYQNKELIIFNTADYPLYLSNNLKNVMLINNSIDFITGKLYDNVGSIRRDALKNAVGSIYICWDDDDLFMPKHIERGIERHVSNGMLAWKPKYSYFTSDNGNTFSKVENNMEASIFLNIDFLRDVDFKSGSGDEHLSWLGKVYNMKQLCIEDLPCSYVYWWGDGLHKQSGNIQSSTNFQTHKDYSIDFGSVSLGRVDLSETYQKVDSLNLQYYGKNL